MDYQTLEDYRAFIDAKAINVKKSGSSVKAEDLSPALKPHQPDVIRWALYGGRRAIFASFGLGKTITKKTKRID